jgi:hypothetical protein
MSLYPKAEYKTSTLFENTTLYDIMDNILNHAKTNIPMTGLVWEIDEELQDYTIDYAWFPRQSYFATIKQIVEACMGQAYMSKEDVLIIEGPSALSDDFIPILKAFITVPEAGGMILRGYTNNIEWITTEIGSVGLVNIELWKAGTKIADIATGQPNNGLYEWAVPESYDIALNYQIKITADVLTAIYYDISDEFTIGTAFKQEDGNVLTQEDGKILGGTI